MAIDKAKIEEWKALSADALRGGVWGWQRYFLAKYSTALAALLAEREELLALLREVEWAALNDKVEWDGTVPACPTCGGVKPTEWTRPGLEVSTNAGRFLYRVGHAPDCRLALLLGAT